MASEGPNSPGTVVNDTGVGSVAWSNPSQADTSDGLYATASVIASQSNYLKATNFGFALPVGATVVGVVPEFQRKWNGVGPAAPTDTETKLVKGGTVQGDNKSAGASWSTTEAYVSFGGASDLWGLALTRDDVNASDFGVVISATGGGGAGSAIQVNHVRMTVYYTEAAPAGVASNFSSAGMYRQTRVVGY